MHLQNKNNVGMEHCVPTKSTTVRKKRYLCRVRSPGRNHLMSEAFVKIDLHGLRQDEAMKVIDKALASASVKSPFTNASITRKRPMESAIVLLQLVPSAISSSTSFLKNSGIRSSLLSSPAHCSAVTTCATVYSCPENIGNTSR